MKKIIIDRSTIDPDRYKACYWGAILKQGKLWDFVENPFGASDFLIETFGYKITDEIDKAAYRQDETTAKEIAASIGYELEFVGNYNYVPMP